MSGLPYQSPPPQGVPMDPMSGINLLSFQPVPPSHSDLMLPNSPPPANVMAGIMPIPPPPPPPAATTTQSKSKTPRKRKSEGPQQPSVNRQKQNSIKDFVHHLLTLKSDRYEDVDFAERALLNISRKLSATEGLLNRWEEILSKQDPNECISLTRPKDGRMTVAKSSVASTKKVFPQITLCQIFRWPHIVFHNDIKSTEGCQFPAAVKPLVEAQSEGAGETLGGDTICINPYHYVITPEAQVRFNKALNRSQHNTSSEGKEPSERKKTLKKTSSGGSSRKTSLSHGKVGSGSSTDEGFGDGEVYDFDPQGVDYFTMWRDKAEGTNDTKIQAFDNEEILKEIKFLSLATGEPCSEKLLEKINIKDLDIILNGAYIQAEPKTEVKPVKEVPREVVTVDSSDSDVIPCSPEEIAAKDEKAISSEEPKIASEPEEEEIQAPASVEQPPAAAAAQPGTGTARQPGGEDSAIQDLLDDIRGSFERQFDEDFDISAAAEDIQSEGGPIAFGLETNFLEDLGPSNPTVSAPGFEGQQLNQGYMQPETQPQPTVSQVPPQQQTQQSGWRVTGPSDSFLNASPMGQDEFDFFGPGQQQQQGQMGMGQTMGMPQPPQQQQQDMYGYNQMQMQPQTPQQQQHYSQYYHQPNHGYQQ